MSKVHKMQKKQAKKLASVLGMTHKEVLTVAEDMQLMGLLKHIDGKEWRIYDGKEWLSLTL